MKFVFGGWVTKLTVTLVAFGTLILRAWFPDYIDAVALAVIAVAAAPWLAGVVRRIELPGGLQIEYQDLEPVTKQVEQSGLLSTGQGDRGRRRHVYAFEELTRGDASLTLIGLHGEIEQRIREIAQSRGIRDENASDVTLIMRLIQEGILAGDEASALHQLLPVLAKAQRGVQVDERVSDWVMNFGPKILDALEERIGEISVPALVAKWRKRDGSMHMEIGVELSKALVKSPRAFLLAMKDDPDSLESWLETVGTNTFTLFESRDEVEDDLYSAYYLELKRLMQNALEPLLETDLASEASRVLSVINEIQIRRIW